MRKIVNTMTVALSVLTDFQSVVVAAEPAPVGAWRREFIGGSIEAFRSQDLTARSRRIG